MYRQALLSLSVLFFMMGFITCLNDILVPFLKEVFKLGYTEASLVQLCFFGAYGLTSIPVSRFIERVGYQKGMIAGFCLAAFGCLLFYPAVTMHTYELFLTALFVLASGIVMLQIAANPFVSVLGPKETSSARLTMVQALNSFGTFTAPFFGSYLILSKIEGAKQGSDAVKYPYIGIAVVLILIAFILMKMKFPVIKHEGDSHQVKFRDVLKAQGLKSGMLGIFLYVGAEVAIGTFMVNYVMERSSMQEAQAAKMVALYWGGAMAGRFLGIFTLQEFKPGRVLSFHALLAIAFILISINSYGARAIYSMILVGFCNSIMFPTIFTLSIKRIENNYVYKASGLLGTAILGGAILPVLTGNMADSFGLRIALLLPAFCYGYIAWYGMKSLKDLPGEKI